MRIIVRVSQHKLMDTNWVRIEYWSEHNIEGDREASKCSFQSILPYNYTIWFHFKIWSSLPTERMCSFNPLWLLKFSPWKISNPEMGTLTVLHNSAIKSVQIFAHQVFILNQNSVHALHKKAFASELKASLSSFFPFKTKDMEQKVLINFVLILNFSFRQSK